ncbi:MAG: hypothetical protein ACFFD4_36415 [Candidatus Odinarchaeota archaeon]
MIKFGCAICGEIIEVAPDGPFVIGKQVEENMLIGIQITYRIYHVTLGQKHINVIICDQNGDFRTVKDSYIELLDERESLENVSSIPFLIKNFRKGLDQIIEPVMMGDTVLVAGNETEVEIGIATLDLFSPCSKYDYLLYTTHVVGPGPRMKFIGIHPRLLGEKIYKSKPTLDFSTNKILNGVKNEFIKKNIIDRIADLDHEEAKKIIQTQVKYLQRNTKKFREIKETQPERMDEVRSLMSYEELRIIEKLLDQINAF